MMKRACCGNIPARGCRLAACCLTASLLLAGCQALHRQPVAENMLASRQIALRGIDARQRGNLDEAESMFRSALEVCPAYDRAHAGYAEVLWQRGSHDLAIAHLEKAVRLSGGDPDLLVQLGRMHLEQSEEAAAMHRVEQALRARRDLDTAWRLRGDILSARGELDEAIACYHRAIAIEDQELATHLALADAYQLQRRPQRALATLEAVAEQHVPGHVPAEISRRQGIAQKALGRYDDAVQSLLAAGAASGDAKLAWELADAQFRAGDLAAARRTVSDGLQRAGQDPGLLRLAGELDRSPQRVAALETSARK